ncbi:hypothetical protein JCM10213_009247 [Rhodosporidiobolus nylandii]
MDTASRSPLYESFQRFAQPRAASPSKVPRTLPSSDSVKDALRFAPSSSKLSPRSTTPMFSVTAELGGDAEGLLSRTLTSKATIAPGSTAASRTHSPAPLLWSDSSWTPGSFTFSPFGEPEQREQPQQNEQEARARFEAVGAAGSVNGMSETDSAVKANSSRADASSSPTLRSKLAPTAQSFVPKVAPLAPAAPPPSLSLDTSAPFPRSGRIPRGSSSPSDSPVEPLTPPSFLHHSEAHLDHHGHLVSHGSRYAIADEILELQRAPLQALHPDEVETLEAYDFPAAGPSGRTRTISEGSNFARGIEQWRMQQSPTAPATFPLRQGTFPPGPSSASGSVERSRSSSIASTASSYFAARPSLGRANTAAQLQSYFGPSNVEVNAPLPAGFDSFDPTYPQPPGPYDPSASHHLSRSSSYASLCAAPYPVLAHPEPFNLTPEDPLYLQARDVFVESSCSSLNGPPTHAHRASMAAHFDRAMCQLNPLATLYGLSQEAANQLLAEPAKSGVSDVVLKVAAMRGRQQQMASVQRSAMGAQLPGPSPNNRKLNLYKTELCRSWEEKGSCRYGVKCQFAHGIHELREVARHPKFKSEICRTFWQQGSCPYGKRCCFIHASGDAALESPSPTKTSPSASRAESPVEPTGSRLQARMTSTAITSAPSRSFGPALSELIHSGNTSSSSSSLQNSPRMSRSDLTSAPGTYEANGALFGLGISQRPNQAPPTYKEPQMSRLTRLSLSGASTPSAVMSPALDAVNFQPHARHDSGNSFITTSSSVASSPLLARHSSSSSLSSAAASPVLLRPLGGEWLSSVNTGGKLDDSLEWPSEMEHLSLDDVPPVPGEH